jgi:arginase
VEVQDVALLGVRPNDEGLEELRALGACVLTSHETRNQGEAAAQRALAAVTEHTEGFWVHLDFDVVDSGEMQAVDCPEPDGLSFAELTGLVGLLVDSPHCVGMELTIYDPDLDPDGSQADAIVRFLAGVFRPNGIPSFDVPDSDG